MSHFDRDTGKHLDSSGGAPHDPSEASSSDADAAAAVIANLVRRTSQRHAAPASSSVAQPDATVAQPLLPVPPVAHPEAPPATQLFPQPAPQPVAPRAAQPVREPVAQRVAQAVPLAMRRPSLPVLIAAGAVAAVLIASGFALFRPANPKPDAAPTSATTRGSAPAAYAVMATDVITDCASHSHGQAKSSFRTDNCVKATRSLATGQVGGRPTVFVISRIQMASAEAAASIKQVLDATGTGNLNDLLREGRTFSGAPSTMPDSGYASVQTDTFVVVAEAGFVKGPSSNTNPALRSAATQVAALVTAKG